MVNTSLQMGHDLLRVLLSLMDMAQSDPLDNLIISRRLTVSLREESRDSRSIPCNKIGDVRVGQYQSRLSIERIE